MEMKHADPDEKDYFRRQVYICQQCGALDRAKLAANEETPLAINCWNCGSGRNMQTMQMRQQGRGMHPTDAPYVDERGGGTPTSPIEDMEPEGDQPS